MTELLKSKKTVTALALLISSFLLAGQGYGGSFQTAAQGEPQHWKSGTPISYVVNPGGVSGYTTEQQKLIIAEAVDSAFTPWKQTPEASIAFQNAGTTAQTNGGANAVNLITFQDSSFEFPPGIVAATVVVAAGGPGPVQLGNQIVEAGFAGQIVDADILFNGAAYAFSPVAGSTAIDLVAVAIHEVGHLLGLGHSGILSSVMVPFAETTTGSPQRTLQADEQILAAFLYPAPTFNASRGGLSGIITRPPGVAVKSAHVIAVSSPGGVPVASQLSGANGLFGIAGLPPGNYQVLVEPLNGPVSLAHVSEFYGDGLSNFATTFAGGRTSPTTVSILAGATAAIPIVLPPTPTVLMNITKIGTLPSPAGGSLFQIGTTPLFLQRGRVYQVFVTAENQTDNSNLTFSGAGITSGPTAGGTLSEGDPIRQAAVTISSSAPLGPSNVLLSNLVSTSALPGAIVVADNPDIHFPPTLTSLSPASAPVAGPAFTLTVTGFNFAADAVVRWNGSARPTTFVNPGTLTASITASDIVSTGTAQVTVFNPEGGASAALPFGITVPPPTLNSLSPSSATTGGAAFTVTVNGSDFLSSSVVQWNGSARTTTFVSSSQLTAAIPASDVATAGTAQITVFNPPPGGGVSASLPFAINNPGPSVSSLSPVSAMAGGSAFVLTVNGSNFVPNAVVQWNASDRTTTFVSSSQLTAAIPASDIATAGTAQITVFSPPPGGGVSSSLSFTINNPVASLATLSPASATSGGLAFLLTVNGSSFVPDSVVRWNGSARTTTFVSSTRLTALIQAGDIATAGSAQVTVFNSPPEGGESNALPFTIYRPPPVVTGGGIVNGASYSGAPSAAGSIVSLFGSDFSSSTLGASSLPLPTTLGGATVRLNNIPVPLFFVSPGQINFQIPWELLGLTQASVTVTADNQTSAPVTVSLSSLAPGIFATNSQGTGQGAILIASTGELAAPVGSIPGGATRPAARGEFLTIYCTGLGDVTNRPATGAAAAGDPFLSLTLATPTVTLGGVPATVSFSGLSPGFVGLYQVNVLVPENAPSGDAVPVVLRIGGTSSNTVTIAVQ